MENYELLLILKANMDEEKRKALIEKIKKILKTSNAEIEKEDEWGIKKLAYPINYKTEGFYVVYDIKAAKDQYQVIDRKLKLEDDIIRVLFTKKHA